MENQTWICDNCGLPIENAEHGWVEWYVMDTEPFTPKGLRLVHHRTASPYGGSCQYADNAEITNQGFRENHQPLRVFLGVDGLMFLLFHIADDLMPKDEALELIKRLHIPGYEQARLHFERAISEGVIEQQHPPGYYNQSEIEAVLRFCAQ